jgi:hypothetical protein
MSGPKLVLALALLGPLSAAPAAATDWRDGVLDAVAERTAERVAARETLPAGDHAEERIDAMTARLAAREEAGALRIRPDIRLVRRTTRIESRLAD